MSAEDPPGGTALEQGGDAACWLASVCDRCGAFNEVPGRPCWRCGGATTANGVAEHAR
jgi:hypothetical protein